MDFKQVKELIKLVNDTNIGEVSLKDGDFEISITTTDYERALNMPEMPVQMVQAPAAPAPVAAAPVAAAPAAAAPAEVSAPAAASPAPSAAGQEVKSPIVGTFYRSSGPDKDPFVKVGDKVKKGDVVCIIEAMKLFNEIESEVEGTVVKVLIDDASPVEYDQPLFIVE